MAQATSDIDHAASLAVVRSRRQWLLLFAGVIALYLLPLILNQSLVSLLNRIIINIIAVQGLNLLVGYTGQISLGQGAFMTVGAYTSTVLMLRSGLPFVLALPLAGLSAGVVGLLFGLPSLRIKGFYLAMATLAAQFIVPWFVRNAFTDTLNGTQGLNSPVPELFGISFDSPERYIYLSLTVTLLTTLVAYNIIQSRSGRAFIAVRDNDLAAELLGVHLFKYKLQAFFLAAVYAGIAGALGAHNLRHISYETFDLTTSVLLLGMLVVGGLGSQLGPFFGAVLVVGLTELATRAGPAVLQVFPNAATTAVRPLVFGIALMLFLIFEPNGLAYRWRQLRTRWYLRQTTKGGDARS